MVGENQQADSTRERYTGVVLAVHGGAGVINRASMPADMEAQYREGLQAALQAGLTVLKAGGNSLDVVEAAIRSLEDCPLFNAGRGSVFTHQGNIEMDAAIMDGSNLKAGAIASVTNIRNPISAARAVMERTPHVLLVGEGAEEFARSCGQEIVDPSYFHTDKQWEKFQRILTEERQKQLDKEGQANAACAAGSPATCSTADRSTEIKKFGTVGAVAVDTTGNLAAATSTGGTMNKQFGRVGDSPLIGCGTYADDRTCAVSTTGHGEYFIRHVAAYDVSALMKYKGLSLPDAAETVIHDILMPAGGRGGMIALDARGNCVLPFNSEGMFRGCIKADGTLHVGVYGAC